jgi:hypothetical protein
MIMLETAPTMAMPLLSQFLKVEFRTVMLLEFEIVRQVPPGFVKLMPSMTTPFLPLILYSPVKASAEIVNSEKLAAARRASRVSFLKVEGGGGA